MTYIKDLVQNPKYIISLSNSFKDTLSLTSNTAQINAFPWGLLVKHRPTEIAMWATNNEAKFSRHHTWEKNKKKQMNLIIFYVTENI